jgi:hypothetical protein
MTRATFNPLSLLAAAALVWALVMLCAGLARAVEIPEQCRVRNIGPQCVYANLATLGRLHDIRSLASLSPRREARLEASDRNIREQLLDLNLVWRGRDHYDFDRSLLPLANSRGCIVSMKAGTPWMHGKSLGCHHSIILTRYDAEGVSFYCPDNPERIWNASRAWFDAGWRGSSLVFDQHD